MADHELRNKVCTRLGKKLEVLPSTFSEHTIFRAPHCLKQINDKCYEPRIISFGPYHHRKPHLEMMEEHKVRYLSMLLARINEDNPERFVALIQGMVEKARNCYAESLSISNDELLEMLVLDGCFIVELLHQLSEWNKDEYIIKYAIICVEILRDLILFENQLPLFVLLELFYAMREYCDPKWYVECFVKQYQEPFPGLRDRDATIDQNANHLLNLILINWLPSRELLEDYSRAPKDGEWLYIRSATELKEAGIRFKKGDGNSLFDIKFENGVVEIPSFTITGHTEDWFRNIILGEQYRDNYPKYFTDFSKVMDCLINTGKDVELLCRCGIIDNWLGDDEITAVMFNKLADRVIVYNKEFFYAQFCNDVNKHFNTTWNKRKATLRHDYFNTPWALISFLAAVFLLLLTFLQTTFTIFPRL